MLAAQDAVLEMLWELRNWKTPGDLGALRVWSLGPVAGRSLWLGGREGAGEIQAHQSTPIFPL